MNRTFNIGSTECRWHEASDTACLRFVGFADEIVSLNHRGWYTDDDGLSGDVLRGVVYQLPAKHGGERYLYGYADPWNDGAACLATEIVSDKDDAARWADHVAETAAEEQRDYSRAWRAARRCEDIADEIKAIRASALQLLKERRGVYLPPNILATIKATVSGAVSDICSLRHERDQLTNDFGADPGFSDV